MTRPNLEARLELVYTTKHRYLGIVREDGTTYYMTRAAVIPEESVSAGEIALTYYAERSRRNLKEYEIPKTAVEMKTHDAAIDRMIQSCIELAKIANRGIYGKAKATRLKKFLKKLGDDQQ